MPMPGLRSRFGRLLLLLLTLALLGAACGNSDDDDVATGDDEPADEPAEPAGEKVSLTGVPGVTDDEIRVAAFGTNSNNPLGTCVLDCYVDGIEAYFAYRNSEGGVHGRELVVSKVLDDELGKNQQRAVEIVSANDTFAAFSATQIASGWKNIAEANIPLFVWNIHPAETAGRPNIFGNQGTICITCTRRATAFVVQQAEATKVASLGYGISENSKKCAQNNVESIEKYSDEIGGAEVVYLNDDLAFGLPNGVGPEVTAMKRAGVELVLACIDLNGMKTIAQEMARQQMGEVPLLHANTYDHEFVANAGDLFEGDYFSLSFRPFEATGDEIETFKTWMEETGSELREISLVGWINADAFYEGLLAAGPEFDRQKVVDALNGMEDYTANGLLAPLDFGRQHDAPTEEDLKTHGNDPDCFALLVLEDGEYQFVPPSSPDEPFICWPAETRDWSEPEARSFTD